jgi:hypothetical protein
MPRGVNGAKRIYQFCASRSESPAKFYESPGNFCADLNRFQLTPVDLSAGFDEGFELLELGYQDVQAFALENERQFGPAAKRHEQHRLILRRLSGLHPDRTEQLRFAVRPVALFDFGGQRARQDRGTFGAYLKAVKRLVLIHHGEVKTAVLRRPFDNLDISQC